MNVYTEFFLQTWGTALSILIIVWIMAVILGKNPSSRHKWLVISALILAIYCILTSWVWIYYMIVFICLPFFIVSLILAYLGWRANGRTRLLKITWWLQGAALAIAFASFVLLLIFD
jgi:hypothetical protein